MFSKWPIRKKLYATLALVLVIVAMLSWGGINGLYAYRSLVRSLSRRVQELPKANELSRSVADLRVKLSERTPFVTPLHYAQRRSLQAGEFHVQLAIVEQRFASYRHQLEQIPDPDRTGGIGENEQEWEKVRAIEKVLARLAELDRDERWLLEADAERLDEVGEELDKLQALVVELPNYLYQNIADFTAAARRQYRSLLVLTWITSVSAAVVFVLFVKLFYNWVFQPLRALVNGSRKVAAGQFHYRIRLETNDEMSELAAALNDMTARFQAIRDDLDRQVQERTKQVVRNEQLASVGYLAAGVAHEINNPLASIAMCAESLEDRIGELLSGESEEQRIIRSYLQMIQTEAFRCKDITERLLDFSRLGGVKRQPTDFGELVQSVVDMLAHLGKYQDKRVEFRSGEAVLVLANPQEIKQVVLNLLTNGLDSLEAGGTVRVEVLRHEGEAELIVSDNGCGMTPEVLEHLFEPFFTRRRGGQGTGLGLSIVYRIVADHDGSIDVHSDGPGRGSRFRVRLPLARANQKEKEHRYQAA